MNNTVLYIQTIYYEQSDIMILDNYRFYLLSIFRFCLYPQTCDTKHQLIGYTKETEHTETL